MTPQEAEAKRLYDECPTVKPDWVTLGAATRSVWLEYAAKTTGHHAPPCVDNKETTMNDMGIEVLIQAKGLTAPRVTPERIEGVIVAEQYHVFPGTTLTVCALTLVNGFTVTGESACASPENFDLGIGQISAREKAVQKIWELEGYALRERLAVIKELQPL